MSECLGSGRWLLVIVSVARLSRRSAGSVCGANFNPPSFAARLAHVRRCAPQLACTRPVSTAVSCAGTHSDLSNSGPSPQPFAIHLATGRIGRWEINTYSGVDRVSLVSFFRAFVFCFHCCCCCCCCFWFSSGWPSERLQSDI